MLIGQHDERLRTIQQERAQEEEERHQEKSTYQTRFMEQEKMIAQLWKQLHKGLKIEIGAADG